MHYHGNAYKNILKHKDVLNLNSHHIKAVLEAQKDRSKVLITISPTSLNASLIVVPDKEYLVFETLLIQQSKIFYNFTDFLQAIRQFKLDKIIGIHHENI